MKNTRSQEHQLNITYFEYYSLIDSSITLKGLFSVHSVFSILRTLKNCRVEHTEDHRDVGDNEEPNQ